MDNNGENKPQLEQQSDKSPATTPPKPFNKRRVIILASVLLVLILVCTVVAFTRNKPTPIQSPKNSQAVQRTVTPQVTHPPVTSKALTGDILSGQLHKLSDNLGLLLNGGDNKGTDPNVLYYEAGNYTSGPYKGYIRYVAVQQSVGPGGPMAYTFASKDKKKYIADGKPEDFPLLGKPEAPGQLQYLNKDKITALDALPTEHANIINLDSHFVLWRDTPVAIFSDITKKDQYGNDVLLGKLQTDFSSDTSLPSPIAYLTIYQNTYASDQPKAPTPTIEPYFASLSGTTATYIVDETGLAYKYILANPQTAGPYQSERDIYDQKVKEFQQKKRDVYPDYPAMPNLRMKNTDIKTDANLYTSYDIAIPQACAFGGDTVIAKNVSDSDLEKIGTSIEGDVYILRDKNHILNKQAFHNKITTLVNAGDGLFGQMNSGLKPPTYDQYMQKNPLLFIKDYWGRWVMLGEFDYHLLGGCGKPVVYLYPPKPTKVSVRFLTPISFDVDIPTYTDGWNVLANPDGALTDLQPQFTDCAEIDSRRFGSEYAKDACTHNKYPYLYWAGTSIHATYPEVKKGWIVDKNHVSGFMNDTLNAIGFNEKEKADFLSYWLPRMISHNAPYYRISFLQNEEMNQIAPMHIDPLPDHYYRYFLDYLPLSEKPAIVPEPEDLIKIKREGFTLVEWGGYLR